ncbi:MULTISPECIES: SGNH/GDSL hydrolase family protein [unclassified Variovorax]|uniref:SGNH/GDSL hydrolase family protein n=1 Tax=unclassified Variovorax TaxID=663243 RepID=UPI003F44BC46
MPYSTRLITRRARLLKTLAAVLGATLAAGCSQSHVARVEDRARVSAASRPGPSTDGQRGVDAAAAGLQGACSVELYGDSILHGGYSGDRRLREPPADALRRLRPRYSVVDRSVNGETASSRSASFAGEARSGRIVVIEHGLNDAMQGLPLESSLRAMVAKARAEGRHVVLTGLSRTLGGADVRAQADATVRRVARDLAVPFVDWGSVPVHATEMADIIHPAQVYSTRLVEHLARVLDTVAPECA